jgi:hypothetical protein
MHLSRRDEKKSPAKTFRRLVLVNEDAYKSAVQCMEEGAVARMAERTVWYDKSGDRGNITRDYSYRDADTTERQPPPVVSAPARTTVTASLPSTSPAIRPLIVSEPVREHVEVMEEAAQVVPEKAPDLHSELRMPTANRKDVPTTHLKKYDTLFKRLRLSEQFRVDAAGRVVLGDAVPIAGSDFHKLMRSMFVSSFASDRTPGRREFLSALKDFGVRPAEVSSPSAKAALTDQAGSGRGSVKRTREGPPGRRVSILRVY